MIKISVIVPVYNVEQYIDKCIVSLLNQTLNSLEIILVDDGSPDNCPSICDEYALKDSRIKVIHKKNEGLGKARNSGLEVATGEYIAFLDSDDYVDITMYETLYEEALNNNLDICYCDVMNFDKKGRNYLYPRSCPAIIYSGKDDIIKFASLQLAPDKSIETLVGYPNMSWNGIYKGEIIRKHKIRFKSEREYVSEDVLFHFENLIYFNRIGWIERALVFHYMSNFSSLTNTVKPQKIQASINMIDFVNKNAPVLYSNNNYMLNAVNSYTIKVIEDISNSIGVLISNPIKRIKFLYQFMYGCYELIESPLAMIDGMHCNKKSYPLVMWAKGRIAFASCLYDLKCLKKRLKRRIRIILNLN